jgi:LuxR family maltose regulon positive regulatory protein
VVALCQLAGIQYRQGRLHEAAATCHEAQQLVDEYSLQTGRPMLVTGYLYARLAEIFYQWNDLKAAKEYAQEGIKLCRQWGIKTIQPTGYLALAKVLQAIGDQAGALNAIRSAKEVAAETSPWLYTHMEAAEAEMRLAKGDLAAASQWAQGSGLRVDDDLDTRDQGLYLVLAKVLLAQGKSEPTRLDQALELLARLLEAAQKTGALGQAIETLIFQALALQAQGMSEEALVSLERALSLAEPGGFVRVFVEGGAPIGRLLRQIAVRQAASSYVNTLLAAFDQEMGNAADAGIQLRRMEDDSSAASVGVSSLLEPLSQRELEVLRLLSTNLSTSGIAERLYISTHTVRSHAKSIYSKLDVHSRIEAVARARELGLLR